MNRSAKGFTKSTAKGFTDFSESVPAKEKKSAGSAVQRIAKACIGLFALFSVLLLLVICLGSFRGFAGLGEEAAGASLAGRLGELRLSAVFGDLPVLSRLPTLSEAYEFAAIYVKTSFRFSTAFVPTEPVRFFSGTAAAVGDCLRRGLSALFGAMLGFLTKGY